MSFCKCGCGKLVTKEKNLYLKGHSEKKKGRKTSDEIKIKISNSLKGIKNGFFNKKHSEETKEKMRKQWENRKLKENYDESLKKRGFKQSKIMKSLWNTGIYSSDEYRKKLSDGIKLVWADKNSVYNSEEWRSKVSKNTREQFKDPEKLKNYINATKQKPNKKELFLGDLIDSIFPNKYKFVGDHKLWINGKNPDFINEDSKKIIEFFGDYWHSKEITGNDNETEELIRTNFFEENQYKVLIIWEHELLNINNTIEKIIRFGD